MRCSNAFGRSSIVAHLDDPLNLLPRNEPQLHGRDRRRTARNRRWPGETTRRSRCGCTVRASPSRIDQHERLDVGDKRLHLEATAVHVGGERSADRQPVCAGLFLRDAPLARAPGLGFEQIVNQRRPHDAGIHLDDPVRRDRTSGRDSVSSCRASPRRSQTAAHPWHAGRRRYTPRGRRQPPA